MFENIVSLMGIASIVCLLVAVMLLLHLIQQAFLRSGTVWGLISIAYPPGTYLYCRKNWGIMRSKFILITSLFGVALLFWVIVKLFSV